MFGVIESRWVRWGCVIGVVGLALATYLVLRADSNAPQTAVDMRPVNPQVRVWSRTVTLIRADGGTSANIENGQPGDAVWLDRSADGRTARDERLGTAAISEGRTSQRTQLYEYADGLLRACGKVGDRPETECTRWTKPTDPPADQRTRAVERLLDRYDHGTGLWEGDISTWQSANALTALIDYMARTGDRQYLGYVDETYRHGDVARTGVPRKTGYNDDELWWALAWIRAFDLTSDPRYLEAAQVIVDGLDDQKASYCNGGLMWKRAGTDGTQVNSITNALYLSATALLSTRVDLPNRPANLARAKTTWAWFTSRSDHSLIDESGLINDHLDKSGDTCVLVNEDERWTYAQGAMISGLVALNKATGTSDLLTAADRIATAATRDGSPFIQNGILNEPSATTCPGPTCSDTETFKGVFVRAYRELLNTGRSETATQDFLTRQATSLRDNLDWYGFRWQGPPRDDDHPNFATQAAALDALNAA